MRICAAGTEEPSRDNTGRIQACLLRTAFTNQGRIVSNGTKELWDPELEQITRPSIPAATTYTGGGNHGDGNDGDGDDDGDDDGNASALQQQVYAEEAAASVMLKDEHVSDFF